MAFIKYRADKLANDCDILEVASLLGNKISKVGGFYSMLCYNSHSGKPDTVLGNFKFYTRTNSYSCFVCDCGGNPINLVREQANLSFSEACEWLINNCRLNRAEYVENNIPLEDKDGRKIKYVPPYKVPYSAEELEDIGVFENSSVLGITGFWTDKDSERLKIKDVDTTLIREEVISKKPLRDLGENNPQAFKSLISGKSMEQICNINSILNIIQKSPSYIPEVGNALYELVEKSEKIIDENMYNEEDYSIYTYKGRTWVEETKTGKQYTIPEVKYVKEKARDEFAIDDYLRAIIKKKEKTA